MATSLEGFELSVRARTCLLRVEDNAYNERRRVSIQTVEELILNTEADLLSRRGLGRGTLNDIKRALKKHNLYLRNNMTQKDLSTAENTVLDKLALEKNPFKDKRQHEIHGFMFEAVDQEVDKAIANWPPFNSAHEGFSILKEEVDELWDHVKTNQKRRDLAAMRKEAIQVAAMAIRFAAECCDESTGRK